MQSTTEELLLDRYKIITRLGRGGFSEVYKAFDTKMQRVVAIKHIHVSRHTADRVLQEARVVALLNHPNIVTIHEFEQDGDDCYLIMELLEGQPLSKILRKLGVLSEQEALVIAIEICRALEAAHRRGIIHRDIKPENVMVLDDGRVKVTDFGIARLKGSSNTTGGDIIGTFAYMSPEQSRGATIDERTDIYSLGTVLYEMLTDTIPFSGESVAETLNLIQTATPQLPSDINPHIDRNLDVIIMKAMGKNPQQRYGSAVDFRRVLELERKGSERPERIVSKIVSRVSEFDEELAWVDDGSWRVSMWHFIHDRAPIIARTVVSILLAYPFFSFLPVPFHMSFTAAIIIYFLVLLKPEYGVGISLFLMLLSLMKYSSGLFLMTFPLLLVFWLFASRRWPLISITPTIAALLGYVRVPFIYPVVVGLVSPVWAAGILGACGCLAFEILNIFLDKSLMPGLLHSYGAWHALKGISSPLAAAAIVFGPFFTDPILLLQPALWSAVSVVSSMLKGNNKWAVSILASVAILVMGYQAMFTAVYGSNFNLEGLMQGLSFSLIILLLLPIFRPPAMIEVASDDELTTDFTTTVQ